AGLETPVGNKISTGRTPQQEARDDRANNQTASRFHFHVPFRWFYSKSPHDSFVATPTILTNLILPKHAIQSTLLQTYSVGFSKLATACANAQRRGRQ